MSSGKINTMKDIKSALLLARLRYNFILINKFLFGYYDFSLNLDIFKILFVLLIILF